MVINHIQALNCDLLDLVHEGFTYTAFCDEDGVIEYGVTLPSRWSSVQAVNELFLVDHLNRHRASVFCNDGVLTLQFYDEPFVQ